MNSKSASGDIGGESLEMTHTTDPQANGYRTRNDDEFDLFELWDRLWLGRKVIFASIVTFSVMSIAYALSATKYYAGTVVMTPVQDEKHGIGSGLGQLGGIAALAGVSIGSSGSRTQEAQEILKSFAFTTEFIEDRALLPILFSDEYNGSVQSDDLPTLQDAEKKFSREVRQISEDKKTGIVTLTVYWNDPHVAADWANQLVERVNNRMREKDVNEARRSITYLESKLQETDVVEMRETIFRLIEAQTKKAMLANVREDYVFKVIDPAYASEKSARPNRKLIVLVGLFLGIIVGALLVFISEIRQSYRIRKQCIKNAM